jgi:hypothetical protein
MHETTNPKRKDICIVVLAVYLHNDHHHHDNNIIIIKTNVFETGTL